MQNEIYLDANATTAVLPAAAQAALQAMQTLFGNPSSTHSAGLRANHMMVEARAHAARVLGIGNGHLLFTSGATEAIQTAIFSALYALRKRQQLGQPVAGLLVYGATEHKAVPESLAHWNRCLGLDLKLRVLPVNNEGRHDLNILRELAPEAALVCTMAANNETGVVSDLAAIGTVLRHGNGDALWLVDCVQALGKLPLNLDSAGMDYAAFSGHKLYAPKGIGLLYVRSQAPFTALMAGGGQEAGQRSGTENMAGIAALGCVLAALGDGHTFRSKNELAGFRDRLAQSLLESFDGLVFNTPFATALPTVINFSVSGVSSAQLLDLFDAAGIRVSAGSACSAAQAVPSYVLQAMNLPDWRCAGAVRMSFGPAADEDFIRAACERIRACGVAWRASHSAAFENPAADTHLAPSLVERVPVAMAEDVEMGIAGSRVSELFRSLSDGLLVDVRERHEHLAHAKGTYWGRIPVSVPMSQLATGGERWLLDQQRPIVFICRSGARSAEAAARLRRLGHAQVWHVLGGFALTQDTDMLSPSEKTLTAIA